MIGHLLGEHKAFPAQRRPLGHHISGCAAEKHVCGDGVRIITHNLADGIEECAFPVGSAAVRNDAPFLFDAAQKHQAAQQLYITRVLLNCFLLVSSYTCRIAHLISPMHTPAFS